MPVLPALLLELGIVLAVLGILCALARRIGFSPVPLYLLAGLALGEGGVAPVPAVGMFVEVGASIGVVLLLLALGLEFSVSEFSASIRTHVPSAVVNCVLNALPGAIAGWALGLGLVGSMALAGITWISSSGIVARLLGDLRRLGNRETPSVLSVLVLEDLAMAAYLPLVGVLAAGGAWWHALISSVVASAAVAVAFIASYRHGVRLTRLLDTADTEQFLLRILGLTLIVAGVAEILGASAAVGAFLVGLVLTGQVADRARRIIGPLRDLFAAAFFLTIGLAMDARELPAVLPVAVALAVVTAFTKVATGWYAARRDGVGPRGRLRAGAALIARGEFSIIIAGMVITTTDGIIGPLTTAYVIILAVVGPTVARLVDLVPPRTGPLREAKTV
ncbi:CPA2 family monovalent cation:H+ antiporter-2 [Nocardiopsis mwathae]|uniref:CPA2 family monovalent cation:H+ antiporter-2 n=1 Tax=Nocardiopsis mwathae TaxID=1472723 RepID=A0A7W9YGF2_9ACTN|nr:cation:proton antiporter [Nocardiopsis mwathae]MBB6171683.1 CPA2 family monovalent cation:H+ antiporter-2 [Nocardiopsis mwathae]